MKEPGYEANALCVAHNNDTCTQALAPHKFAYLMQNNTDILCLYTKAILLYTTVNYKPDSHVSSIPSWGSFDVWLRSGLQRIVEYHQTLMAALIAR